MANWADEITQYLSAGQLALPMALALAAGFLTALSPCVYPLIPITLSIMGARKYESHLQGFLIAGSYVLGMTLIYAGLGVLFASLGLLAGSIMQSKITLVVLAIFFMTMALSLLDILPLTLPSRLLGLLSSVQGSGFRGAFLMGMVAGLVAAPCTGPVIGFILVLIAERQDLMRGLFLMIAFSVGLGLPFLILGTFSSALAHLPKSGSWMKIIKIILSTAMMAVAIYYLSQALGRNDQSLVSTANLNWHRIDSQTMDEHLFDHFFTKAQAQKQPILIDFYADWCVACREFDTLTFADKRVKAVLERYYLIKIDATTDSPILTSIQRRFSVLGLPTILIFSTNAYDRPQRILGFFPPEKFLRLF